VDYAQFWGVGEMADKSGGRAFGGWVGWLMKRLRAGRDARPRLELVERITIGPRQNVALIEAEGQRLLVACSAEGAPVFYPLHRAQRLGARVSW
jgi:flagellar biogenesis protein FliO